MEIKSVLVTGAAGYIGTVLVEKLLSEGFTVRGMDSLFYEQCLASWAYRQGIERKDIRTMTVADFSGVDAVVHLAALSNDPTGALDESLTEEINYKETARLAWLAKQAGVKVFVFSSSCSVYGKSDMDWVSEETPVQPLTAYARSKNTSEEILRRLTDDSFSVYLLRNSTVYGYSPCFRDDLVVNNFTVQAYTKNHIEIHSDGTPWRPLIDVRDLSSIIFRFLKYLPKECVGKPINIGFQENNVQVKEILDLVCQAIPSCEVLYTGKHGSDTRSYRVRFDMLKSIFPDLEQIWPLHKSITDLVANIPLFYSKLHYDTGLYTRLTVLKNLMVAGHVDDRLFWQHIQSSGDILYARQIAFV